MMSRILSVRKILLFLGDVFFLYLALLLTVLIGFLGESYQEVFLEHILPFSLVYVSWLMVFYIFGLYDLNIIRSKLNLYPRLLGALGTSMVIGIIFFYLLPLFGLTPKTNLVLNVIIFGVFVFMWRKAFYSLFAAHFLNKVAIIGEQVRSQDLAHEIQNRPYLGYKVVSVVQNHDLVSQVQAEKIDTLIVAEDIKSKPEILKILYQCLPARVNFLDFSGAYELICQKIPVHTIDITWFLENLREGEKGFFDKLKRGIDLILASTFLLLTAPLLPLIALMIKLEDVGPILYTQERIGKDRKPFFLFKFRSMKVDAENGKAIWAERNDPRITKAGRLLRRTHLDELPQMINVIRGDISLVGPRPERPEFVEQLEREIPHYHLRHLIKPGFTGWAQLKFRYGRSVIDSQEKFQYDLYYLKNRNVFLDVGILLKTFQLFFRKD